MTRKDKKRAKVEKAKKQKVLIAEAVARKRAKEMGEMLIPTKGQRVKFDRPELKPLPRNPRFYETLEMFAACHSPVQPKPIEDTKPKPIYEGEMAEREAAAQQEIERKKGRVAAPYNKGNLVYYSDDMVADFVKGSHRRR